MRKISNSKISYYGRNKSVFFNNPRYKSSGRVKTKPTFNQLIKQTHNQFIENWGPYMEVNNPALYETLTGKKAKKSVIEFSEVKEEVKKKKKKTKSKKVYLIDNSVLDDLEKELLN